MHNKIYLIESISILMIKNQSQLNGKYCYFFGLFIHKMLIKPASRLVFYPTPPIAHQAEQHTQTMSKINNYSHEIISIAFCQPVRPLATQAKRHHSLGSPIKRAKKTRVV
ncbi:hypothetical protein GKO28_07210 [Deefgea sp. CFH1-16]|nr:hypothetical protein [Deefgea sp. CFH1-16]